MRTLGAKVPPDLYESCSAIMKEEGWGPSILMRNALQMFVDVYKWEKYREFTRYSIPDKQGGEPSIEGQTATHEGPSSEEEGGFVVGEGQEATSHVGGV